MRLLAAAFAAAAVLAPAALADPPDTRTHTDVNSTRTITVCGFPVVIHSSVSPKPAQIAPETRKGQTGSE